MSATQHVPQSAQAFEELLETFRAGVKLSNDTAVDERDAAEGYRFFTHLLRAGLSTYLDNDPERPRFTPLCSTRFKQPFAHDSATVDVTGPVPYAVYDLAPMSGDAAYVIRGTRGTVGYVSFFLYSGGGWTGHMPERLGAHLHINDVVCDAEGAFEIYVGRTAPEGTKNFLELDDDAHSLLIRQFFKDPDTETAAMYNIETVPSPGRTPPLTDAELARRFRSVATYMRELGNNYLEQFGRMFAVGDDVTPNEFVFTHIGGHEYERGAKAGMYVSQDHWYVYSFYELGPDDALVMRVDPPRSDWWGIYAQNRYVQTNVDDLYARNFVSNGNVVLEADGSALIVASHRDPGVPNWLDTDGRESGQLLMLWSVEGAGADRMASVPSITTSVVPVERVTSEGSAS